MHDAVAQWARMEERYIDYREVPLDWIEITPMK